MTKQRQRRRRHPHDAARMKWREGETLTEWCLRVVATNDKKIVAGALREVEAESESWDVFADIAGSAFRESYESPRDLLRAKLRLLEDQDDNDK